MQKGWEPYDTSFFKLDLKHESRLTYANWVFPFYPEKLICLNDNSRKLIIGQERMGVMKDYANLSSSILDINLVSRVLGQKYEWGWNFLLLLRLYILFYLFLHSCPMLQFLYPRLWSFHVEGYSWQSFCCL